MKTQYITKLFSVISVLLCIFFFSQCSEDEVIVKQTVVNSLDVYPQVLPFDNQENVAEVKVTTTEESWTASIPDTVKWMTISQNENILSVKIQANEGVKRTTSITVITGTGDKTTTKSVLVIQDAAVVAESIFIQAPDFSQSRIYNVNVRGKKIGELCLEYLSGESAQDEAIVFYSMVNGKVDTSNGYVMNNTGTVAWVDDECNYTPGAESDLEFVYIMEDGSYATTGTTNKVEAELTPELLVDQRGTETNNYGITKIANTYWITKNLNATKFTDGTDIPTGFDQAAWGSLKTPGCAVYECDDANNTSDENYRFRDMMGVLYNAWAVLDPKIAPEGWRVASMDDWNAIISYLGGASVAGGHFKELGTDYWGRGSFDGEDDNLKNVGATNYSGLACRPAGYRHWRGDLNYHSIGWYAYFFTSTQDGDRLKMFWCGFDSTVLGFGAEPLAEGCPIRLVRE